MTLAQHRLRQRRTLGYPRPEELLYAILYDVDALYARPRRISTHPMRDNGN